MEGIRPRSARLAPFLSWTICGALVAYTLFLAPKFWRTNDDPGMAMLACGYGISDAPSPYLIFSNGLWGWVVNRISGISGTCSYDYMSYAALILSAVAILWSLHRKRTPAIIAAGVFTAIYIPAVLTPHFTVVSGYLAAGAALLLYTQSEDSGALARITPWIMLFVSALIRLDEFFIVCAVSCPFFLMDHRWRIPSATIKSQVFHTSLLLLAILAAYGGESRIHSQDTEWRKFEQLSAMRPILDFHLADSLAAHPEALEGSGITPNDIALASKWFFADATIFDPGKISMIADKIPLTTRIHTNLRFYRRALNPFLDPQFDLLAAIFLLSLPFMQPRAPALCACLAIILLMLGTLVAGRPGMTHIFLPLMALADCFALASLRPRWPALFTLLSMMALACSLLLSVFQLQSARQLEPQAESIRRDFSLLRDGSLYVVWAGYSPDKLLIQPFEQEQELPSYSRYGLDSWQRAPFALHTLHRYTNGLDFVQALLLGQSLKVFAPSDYIGLLKIFFREHYQSTLNSVRIFTIDRYNCYRISVDPDSH